MAYIQTRHVDVGGLLSGTFAELARIPRALAIYLGSNGFKHANPKLYRKLAYGLIALAALSSMPLLDPLFR